jgi:hypothetical protein
MNPDGTLDQKSIDALLSAISQGIPVSKEEIKKQASEIRMLKLQYKLLGFLKDCMCFILDSLKVTTGLLIFIVIIKLLKII